MLGCLFLGISGPNGMVLLVSIKSLEEVRYLFLYGGI